MLRILTICLLLFAAFPALAQDKDLEHLVQTLESAPDRARLVGQLKTLMEADKQAEPTPETWLDGISDHVEAFGRMGGKPNLATKRGSQALVRAVIASAAIVAVAGLVLVALGRRFPLRRRGRRPPVLPVALRGLVAALAGGAMAQAWGLDIMGALASEAGRRLLSGGVSIALVLALALVVWELVSGAIERYLSASQGIERSARARTLLPLARNALLIVLVAMVALIVLAELGINIAPLLAGAGVVGIAIGFGAQKLVQDVITGAFILFENTISVGDVVKLSDGHSGAVESLSIRAIRLRDGSGFLHTVPFSAVGSVVNMSRDFAYACFEVPVAPCEDAERVMGLLRQVGAELKADPAFAPHILAELEVLGLDRFEAAGMVIKAQFKTLALKQWGVAREFNLRMKRRFDQDGIAIPFPLAAAQAPFRALI